MKYRTLGKTNTAVSEVSLGTWQLGSADWGVVDESDALAILQRAADGGVTLFDTADVYGGGTSERVIGKFLRETSQTVHVATKLGRAYASEHGWPEVFSLQDAREATQLSLKNLGVDSIFLQQWHCIPTDMLRSGEAFDHLESLKQEGLIQNWGCSVESNEEALLAMAHPGCATLQMIFNIFRQKVTEVLPMAQQKNIGILARVPLASGLLSGRFKAGYRFAETDHRNYNRDGAAFNVGETFAGLPYEVGAELAGEVADILHPAGDATLAQLALRWLLDHEAVSTVIPGASKLAQVASNEVASSLPPISAGRHAALNELYRSRIEPHIRGPY